MKHDFLTVNYPKIINITELTEKDRYVTAGLFPTLNLVEKGPITIATSDQHLIIQEGDLFIAASTTPFQLTPTTEGPLLVSQLTFYESLPYFEKLFVAEASLAHFPMDILPLKEHIFTIKNCYQKFQADPQLKLKLILDAEFMTALSLLLPSQIHQKEAAFLDKDLQKAIDYFSDHYAQSIKISQVAVMIGIHPNYFSKKFKEYYGIPPKAFLTSLRIKKASVLMASTDLSLKEIAKTVGYSDYLSFRKAFKLYYQDYSPTYFKDKKKK